MTSFEKLLGLICVKNGFSLAEVRDYRKNLKLVKENLPENHIINTAKSLSSAIIIVMMTKTATGLLSAK